MTYLTIQGDTWDMISKKTLGDTRYTGNILQANLRYNHYFIFPAGIVLTIPDVDTAEPIDTVPWKEAEG